MKSTNHSTQKNSNQVATVIFIDAGVENYQQLVNGVISAAEVFVLDAAADGIEQISQVLQQRQDVGAVHIVSHGVPGGLYLGNTQLSLDTFNRYAAQLQTWNVPALLLYGCNVAAGDAGAEFIAKLHQLTGANIAASTTPVGNSALGGNWELEVVLGQEQPRLAFQPSVMAAYEGILNIGTAPILSVGGSAQYNGSSLLVAPLLTITDPDVGDTLNGASVVLNGAVTAQESLGIAGQTSGSISGITWNYDVSSGVMRLNGVAAVSTYESVLRQVTYQNASPTTAARDIQFTLGTALFNPENGHTYKFVAAPNISWEEARAAAASMTNLGLPGYLATITSASENDFVAKNKLGGEGWIGASDAEVEGVWKWVTGPEAGTQFWQGLGPNQEGTPVNGQYSNWSTMYGSIASPEPNDFKYEQGGNALVPEGEDYAHFLSDPMGKWNDYPNTITNLVDQFNLRRIEGYVVEFGGMPATHSSQITGTTTVTFNPGPNPVPTQTSTWDFVTRDFNLDGATDIVAIKKNGTGSKKTEVHIMNGANTYDTWLLQTGTILHETDSTWDFGKGDVNRDRQTDILAIKKSGTGSKKTEVHIMNAADNYQSWVMQTETILHETDDTWTFQTADYNNDGAIDLIGIKKSGTGSKSTEIHILDGATNYKSFLMQTKTVLHETGNTWEFQVGDYNGDGAMDIIGISKSGTGSKSTEIHMLNGATNYQSFLLQTKTALHETGNNWGFLMDDYNSNNSMGVISLKENETGSKTTEAHILNAGTTYQSWMMQTGTILPEIAPSAMV